ncbi:MAG: hypothetical protein SVV03_02105 [Candidatus Nanohaloarchaea archaeon]|nr:hypothetical protein [Candidatus Nanohaloarchaea archaeon]
MGELYRSIKNLFQGRTKSEGSLISYAGIFKLLSGDEAPEKIESMSIKYGFSLGKNKKMTEIDTKKALEDVKHLASMGETDRIQTYAIHHIYENGEIEKHYLQIRQEYICLGLTYPYSMLDLEYKKEK